jgi:hypothetical protein
MYSNFVYKNAQLTQVNWLMPVILGPGKLRKEDQKFEGSMEPYLKKKQNTACVFSLTQIFTHWIPFTYISWEYKLYILIMPLHDFFCQYWGLNSGPHAY